MLRPACLEDAAAVADVLIESRKVFLPFAPMTHEPDEVRGWVAQHLIPSGGVTVATLEGVVVAVLAISEDEADFWINQLYVLPGFENQGLGTTLLRHAHAITRKPVHLYTFQQNAGARRFYERHGYSAIAVSDGQNNEEGCPDVLYERRAPPAEA